MTSQPDRMSPFGPQLPRQPSVAAVALANKIAHGLGHHGLRRTIQSAELAAGWLRTVTSSIGQRIIIFGIVTLVQSAQKKKGRRLRPPLVGDARFFFPPTFPPKTRISETSPDLSCFCWSIN